MALKKAYCTHCATKNKKIHIFTVNPEAEHVFCPRCMEKLDPKVAIADYQMYISNLVLEAQRTLYQKTDFYNAYCQFADILDIEPESEAARYGRTISLIYMSTLRHSKFKEATVLIESEATQYYHKTKDLRFYAKFLMKCNRAIDEYLSLIPKRLTTRKVFYNLECIKLYVTRLDEALALKKVILEELTRLADKVEDHKVQTALEDLTNSIKELEVDINMKHPCADGYKYALAKKSKQGEMIFGRGDQTLKPLQHLVSYTLNDHDNKGRLIKDKVYPDNTHIAKLVKKTIPAMIIDILLGLGLLAPYFLIKEKYAFYFLIGACVFFGLSLLTLAFHIKWKHQLSKRRHLID